MAQSTFDGPVVSLGSFATYGPSVLPAVLTTATTLTRDSYAGRLIRIDGSTGFIITLPTIVTTANAVSSGPGNDPNTLNNLGMTLDFLVTTTVSGTQVILCGGSDIIIGNAMSVSTGTPANFAAVAASAFVKVSMNGTTTGGINGTYFRFTAVAANRWLAIGSVNASGTAATPFSV